MTLAFARAMCFSVKRARRFSGQRVVSNQVSRFVALFLVSSRFMNHGTTKDIKNPAAMIDRFAIISFTPEMFRKNSRAVGSRPRPDQVCTP